MAEQVINELNILGIKTIEELDKIIPEDFEQQVVKLEKYTNYCGMARQIMIIHDPEAYFTKAWKKAWWNPKVDGDTVYTHYGINLDKYTG